MAERVLITGARAPAALDLARSFKAAGFDVHMADCTPSCMSAFSRAATKVHHYPSPRRDFAAFKHALSDLVARIDPVLIVPTCEEVFYLAACGDHGGKLFAPPFATLRSLHSKYQFAPDAAALGLAAPETIRLTSACALPPLLGDANALVFKPEFSRFGAQTLVSPSRPSILALQPSEQHPWVAQQRVHGEEVSFYAVSSGGRLTAFSAYRSPWKFSGGAGYAFETIAPALHDRLFEIAHALAAKLIPRGQFACDVIVDADGTPWLLECNPRATSGVHLFDRSPALALALLGRAEAPLVVRRATAKHIGPALYAYGVATALKQKRWREWRAWRKQSADVICAPGDAAPLAGALIDTTRMSAHALLRRKTLAEIATIDIEWNGEPL